MEILSMICVAAGFVLIGTGILVGIKAAVIAGSLPLWGAFLLTGVIFLLIGGIVYIMR